MACARLGLDEEPTRRRALSDRRLRRSDSGARAADGEAVHDSAVQGRALVGQGRPCTLSARKLTGGRLLLRRRLRGSTNLGSSTSAGETLTVIR